ncbi:hypothetical protein [Enterococcus faecium]|uniref:hypothetical protein n=1 Tax=Enterococcus faecium TaxID=1352 RepID=UPI003AAA3029
MRTWTKSDVNVDKKRCKRGQKAMQTWTKSDANVDKKRCGIPNISKKRKSM